MREDRRDPPMNDPESLTRKVIEACADCDQCRTFMGDESCLFFRKLYLLYDKERERNEPITSKDMRLLVDLCNMCGLCPCADIRVGVREAKDAFVARDGMKPALRVLEDVRTVGKVCGAFPQISNLLLDNDAASALFKRIAEIHPERKLPRIPPKPFPPGPRSVDLTASVKGLAGRSPILPVARLSTTFQRLPRPPLK